MRLPKMILAMTLSFPGCVANVADEDLELGLDEQALVPDPSWFDDAALNLDLLFPHSLRVHTCDAENATTSDPVTARFQYLTFEGQAPDPVTGLRIPRWETRTVALNGAGATRGEWQEFRLDPSDLPVDIGMLGKVVITKMGSNAWCIDQVEITHNNRLRRHFEAKDARTGTYVTPRPAGVIWIDDDHSALAPTSSVTFSEGLLAMGDAAKQRPTILEIDTCPASVDSYAGTDDRVAVSFLHDTTTEIIELNNVGNDREPGDTDSYVLDEEGIRSFTRIEIGKQGSDRWCIAGLRLRVGGVTVAERTTRTYLDSSTADGWDLLRVDVNKTLGGSVTTSDARIGLPLKVSQGVRVMSMNARYTDCLPQRQRGQAELLLREAIDIVGIQENNKAQKDAFATALNNAGGGYSHVADVIKRADGTELSAVIPIFFRQDRFTLLEKGSTDLPRGSESDPACEGQSNRGARWVRLRDGQTNKQLVVYNTHLDHKCNQPTQVKALATYIRSKGHDGLPLVIVGDMNSKPTSTAFAEFTGTSSLQLGLSVGTPINIPTFHKGACGEDEDCVERWGVPGGAVIDYVFHSSAFTASLGRVVSAPDPVAPVASCGDVEINGHYSDHRPIFTTLRMR